MNKHLQTQSALLALIIILFMGYGTAYAYDFTAVSPSGHVLYYNIIDSSLHTVGLVSPHYDYLLGEVVVPEKVEYEGIDYTVTSLLNSDNYGCFQMSSITGVMLPSSINNVEGAAFYQCSSLTTIVIFATTPPSLTGYTTYATFQGLPSNCVLFVPPSTTNAYQSLWSGFSGVINEFEYGEVAISVSVGPAGGGTTSGTGTYEFGMECTLTATASAGYVFHNWTENGAVVSTDASYTFVVLRGRNLVANFVAYNGEGTIHGLFSVSNGNYVFFSQGNLQYIGSAETPYWKFADHQWDYLGATTGQNSGDQNKDRDLFGWGTSGYNHGANSYQPWSTSQTYSDYYAYGNSFHFLFNQTGQADWGYNAISNGGNQENIGWRTLTTQEWQYLFNTRSTPSGIRYAKAKVNSVNGVILLPDDWDANYYTLNDTNSNSASYTTNTITATQWASLEQHGAVFLPSAGYRHGTSVNLVGSNGVYWSSTYYYSTYAWRAYFNDSYLNAGSNSDRCYGLSVRLVVPSQRYSFAVNASPSPAEGGAVSGAGAYQGGAGCTLTATASAGYVFNNWTEDGAVVSTDATYTFLVSRDRNLVANFVAEGNIVFADTNVKTICVANWDTNGDGELSYVEAANVTSLGNVFKNNTDIQSFNELQYFIFLGSIGEQAFYGCTGLTQITIPEPVTSVGSKAFWNCPALQTVTFNARNCTSMQTNYNSNIYSVFSSNESGGGPALSRVNIGSSVQRIPDYAFKDAANIYPGLAIRSSVTTIGAHAFENCRSITTITFQNTPTLTTIGDYAFSGCTAWNKPLSLPNSLNTIGAYAFNGCSALTGNLAIPNTVTAIGEGAFSGCSGFNGTLTLPVNESFTTIDQYTFNGCSGLTGTLTIPANVTEVAHSAFRGCNSFTGPLVLHDAMTTIGEYAFYGCSGIPELTIGQGISTIGGYAFWNCPNLATVHFNATNCTSMVTNSQYPVFNSGTNNGGATPIVTLTISENVTKIPSYAFSNSSLAMGNLLLPSGLTNIGQYAFSGCSGFTGDLVIPNSVNAIGQYAFSGCSGFDGSLTVGRGVQTINQNTFANCSGFSGALILGTQVNNIGNNAFQNCGSFALVITENPNPIAAQSSTFTGMNYSIPVYVPDGLVGNYQNATGWNNFTNYIEQFTFWDNLDSANWSDEMNWLSMSLPTENDVVCITYNCDLDIDFDVLYVYIYNINDVLTIKANQTLYTTYGVGLMSPSQLVIEPGGHVIYGNGSATNATQTVALSEGTNWVSFNVETSLDDLKAALVEALPGATSINIKSQNDGTTTYNGTRWRGSLGTLDPTQMYMVTVPSGCELALEGSRIQPSGLPLTIKNGNNWMAFPLSTSMSLNDAFAGFNLANGDVVKSQNNGMATYNGTRWRGSLSTLEPGQGYIFNSAVTGERTLIFPN